MIAEKIEKRVFTQFAPTRVHHVRPIPYADRTGLVARVYDQMMRDFQLVPPITVHSPVPRLLAGVWTAVRESVVAGPANRVIREAAIEAVSRINTCSFCVDVHSMALYGARQHDVANLIARGEEEKIADPELRGAVQWAAATRTPEAENLRNPPFSETDAAQIIGSVLLFHYINRPVNVFLDESPLPALMPSLKGVVKRIGGSVIGRRTLNNTPAPGDSLALLPEAPLPEEFKWAASNPYVARAWARFAAVAEEAGREALPEEVRQLVLAHVNGWNGEEMPLSRRWVEDAIASLSEEQKPAARLAILTALASHQVDEGVIELAQKQQPDDAHLVNVVAWASFAATRRISRWLRPPV